MIERFVAHNVWLIAGAATLIMGILTWDSSRKAKWFASGKEAVRVETRKANDAAVSKADSVRAGAESGRVRGQRDKYSLD